MRRLVFNILILLLLFNFSFPVSDYKKFINNNNFNYKYIFINQEGIKKELFNKKNNKKCFIAFYDGKIYFIYRTNIWNLKIFDTDFEFKDRLYNSQKRFLKEIKHNYNKIELYFKNLNYLKNNLEKYIDYYYLCLYPEYPHPKINYNKYTTDDKIYKKIKTQLRYFKKYNIKIYNQLKLDVKERVNERFTNSER